MKTKEKILDKNVSIDCNDLQYYGSGIYQAMQEYSDQNTKPLIDEIARLRDVLQKTIAEKFEIEGKYISKIGDCARAWENTNRLIEENSKLKQDLKTAESVNEQLTTKYCEEIFDEKTEKYFKRIEIDLDEFNKLKASKSEANEAVEFAEWLNTRYCPHETEPDVWIRFINLKEKYSSKQLYEIFKRNNK